MDDTAIDNVEQPQLSEEDIREEQKRLAERVGMSVDAAYAKLDRGELRGTILESKLSMLRFLLSEDLPAAAE